MNCFELFIQMYQNSRKHDRDELIRDLDLNIFNTFIDELLEKLRTIQTVMQERRRNNLTPIVIDGIGGIPEIMEKQINTVQQLASENSATRKETASLIIDMAMKIRKYELKQLFKGTKYGMIIKQIMEIPVSDREIRDIFISEKTKQQIIRVLCTTMPDQAERIKKNQHVYIRNVIMTHIKQGNSVRSADLLQPNESVYWDIKEPQKKQVNRSKQVDRSIRKYHQNMENVWNNDYQRSLISGDQLIELTFDLEQIYDHLNGYDTLQWYPYMNYDEYVNIYLPLMTYAGGAAPFIALVKGFFNYELVNIILYDKEKYPEETPTFLYIDLDEALHHIKPEYLNNLYFKAVASKHISNAQKFYKIPDQSDIYFKSMETALKEMRIMSSLGIDQIRQNHMRIWTINHRDGLVFMCEPLWSHRLRSNERDYFEYFELYYLPTSGMDWKLIPVLNRKGQLDSCRLDELFGLDESESELDEPESGLDINVTREDSMKMILETKHVDRYSMQIICEKVATPNDIIKIAKTCRAYRELPELMRINQMPLNKQEREMFRRVQEESDSIIADLIIDKKTSRTAGEERQETVYKLIDEEQPLWEDLFRCRLKTEALKTVLELVIDHMWNDMRGSPKEN